MIRILCLIIFCFSTISFAETIPLPPSISLKQQQSVKKIIDQTTEQNQSSENTATKNPQIAIEEHIKPKVNKKAISGINIKLGVSNSDGDIYSPLASTICIFANEIDSEACRIVRYDNNIDALLGLLNGDIDVLITNSLLSRYVVDGNEPFKNNMQHQKVRFVAAFSNEQFTIVARRDAKIKQLDDLKGASISISKPHTKTRLFFEELMKVKQWQNGDFKQVIEFSADDQIKAICNGDVQAIPIVGEEKNKYIKKVTRLCEVNVIGLSQEEMNLLSNDAQYVPDIIKGGEYIGVPRSINTISAKTIILTTSDVENDLIEFLMNSISKNLNNIKLLHFALANLTIEKMLNEGRIAPLHDGVNAFVNKNGYSSMLK